MSKEIEGKWLPRNKPELFEILRGVNPPSNIVQGYVSIDPNGNVVRVRDEDGVYSLTTKGKKKHGESPEMNVRLTRDEYEFHLGLSGTRVISKARYRVPLAGFSATHEVYRGLTAEVDVFKGRLAGLVMIEVETTEAPWLLVARANPLPWFGKDVTDDIQYSNAYLSGQPTQDS